MYNRKKLFTVFFIAPLSAAATANAEYVHNDPINATDPNGERTLFLGVDLALSIPQKPGEKGVVVTNMSTGKTTFESGGGLTGSVGVYISFPFFGDDPGTKFDAGVFATGGGTPVGESPAYGAASLEIGTTKNDSDEFSGRGSVTSVDAVAAGGDVIFNGDGEAIGGSVGIGPAAGVARFDTNTASFGVQDAINNVKDLFKEEQ